MKSSLVEQLKDNIRLFEGFALEVSERIKAMSQSACPADLVELDAMQSHIERLKRQLAEAERKARGG